MQALGRQLPDLLVRSSALLGGVTHHVFDLPQPEFSEQLAAMRNITALARG